MKNPFLGGIPGGETPVNKGPSSPNSRKHCLLESRRESPVGTGCLPRRMDGRTDGMLE